MDLGMAKPQEQTFPCDSCGADLHYQPGTQHVRCPYCGSAQRIEASTDEVRELGYVEALQGLEDEVVMEEHLTIECPSCRSQTTFEPNITADECAFCGTKIVVQGKSTRAIRPAALLPFKVKRQEAARLFKTWLSKLWFAPNALKKFARMGGLDGLYIPYWTYDCHATTTYSGQRGEHYYVTETYRDTDTNGKTVTRTRQVRKTRWYPASGTVSDTFDDILVLGSTSLPEKEANALEPWDLEKLIPYQENYLSGFKVQSYQVNLKQGFEVAKTIAESTIRRSIRRDIGGDEQRISHMNPRYSDISFKHVLLPVWISAYRYRDKVYRFLVNARTGEVQGERPWSWIKILFTVLVVAAIIVLVVSSGQSR